MGQRTHADPDHEHLTPGATLRGWFARDITGDARSGSGAWSTGDIVSSLETGVNAHATASGPMAEEIELASSRMSDADVRTIARALPYDAISLVVFGTNLLGEAVRDILDPRLRR